MNPVPLREGEIYRLTGTADYEAVIVDGEFAGEFGDSGLFFRNIETDPSSQIGFRTAWYIEWSDLASIETPSVLAYGEEE
jgi:hypothetical protein